jgi:hypothetical protein
MWLKTLLINITTELMNHIGYQSAQFFPYLKKYLGMVSNSWPGLVKYAVHMNWNTSLNKLIQLSVWRLVET